MLRSVAGFGLLPWLCAAACGGNVEGGSQEPNESPSTASPTAKDSSDGTDPDSGADNPDADTELGSCKLGPLEYAEPGAPCAWVAKDRCYESREMACNCACPRSRNSQCASGFESGPDGHVWVACN